MSRGKRFRLVIEGAEQITWTVGAPGRIGYTIKYRLDGKDCSVDIPGEAVASAEPMVDPLPTEPGAVIEATVYGRRNRLVLEQGVPPYRWRTLLDDENLSRALFEPAEITDWTLLLPGVTS